MPGFSFQRMSETNTTKRYSSGRFQRGRHEQLHAKPPENHHASKPLNSSNFKRHKVFVGQRAAKTGLLDWVFGKIALYKISVKRKFINFDLTIHRAIQHPTKRKKEPVTAITVPARKRKLISGSE